MKILDALKGIGGEFEINRVLGAFGTIVYVISAPAFVWAGKVVTSIEAFCLAYPAGIAACIGATAGSIALKDRSVATAKIIEQTGAQPGQAAAATNETPQPVNVAEVGGKPVEGTP